MTTIAYRDGVLASDTRQIRGDTIDPGLARKIFKAKDGRLLAATGDFAEAVLLISWLKNPSGDRPPLNDNTRVIEISPNGKIRIYEGKGSFDAGRQKFNAWGSGCQAALVAMQYGATAREAVLTAMKYDYGTGGRVRSVSFK